MSNWGRLLLGHLSKKETHVDIKNNKNIKAKTPS